MYFSPDIVEGEHISPNSITSTSGLSNHLANKEMSVKLDMDRDAILKKLEYSEKLLKRKDLEIKILKCEFYELKSSCDEIYEASLVKDTNIHDILCRLTSAESSVKHYINLQEIQAAAILKVEDELILMTRKKDDFAVENEQLKIELSTAKALIDQKDSIIQGKTSFIDDMIASNSKTIADLESQLINVQHELNIQVLKRKKAVEQLTCKTEQLAFTELVFSREKLRWCHAGDNEDCRNSFLGENYAASSTGSARIPSLPRIAESIESYIEGSESITVTEMEGGGTCPSLSLDSINFNYNPGNNDSSGETEMSLMEDLVGLAAKNSQHHNDECRDREAQGDVPKTGRCGILSKDFRPISPIGELARTGCDFVLDDPDKDFQMENEESFITTDSIDESDRKSNTSCATSPIKHSGSARFVVKYCANPDLTATSGCMIEALEGQSRPLASLVSIHDALFSQSRVYSPTMASVAIPDVRECGLVNNKNADNEHSSRARDEDEELLGLVSKVALLKRTVVDREERIRSLDAILSAKRLEMAEMAARCTSAEETMRHNEALLQARVTALTKIVESHEGKLEVLKEDMENHKRVTDDTESDDTDHQSTSLASPRSEYSGNDSCCEVVAHAGGSEGSDQRAEESVDSGYSESQDLSDVVSHQETTVLISCSSDYSLSCGPTASAAETQTEPLEYRTIGCDVGPRTLDDLLYDGVLMKEREELFLSQYMAVQRRLDAVEEALVTEQCAKEKLARLLELEQASAETLRHELAGTSSRALALLSSINRMYSGIEDMIKLLQAAESSCDWQCSSSDDRNFSQSPVIDLDVAADIRTSTCPNAEVTSVLTPLDSSLLSDIGTVQVSSVLKNEFLKLFDRSQSPTSGTDAGGCGERRGTSSPTNSYSCTAIDVLDDSDRLVVIGVSSTASEALQNVKNSMVVKSHLNTKVNIEQVSADDYRLTEMNEENHLRQLLTSPGCGGSSIPSCPSKLIWNDSSSESLIFIDNQILCLKHSVETVLQRLSAASSDLSSAYSEIESIRHRESMCRDTLDSSLVSLRKKCDEIAAMEQVIEDKSAALVLCQEDLNMFRNGRESDRDAEVRNLNDELILMDELLHEKSLELSNAAKERSELVEVIRCKDSQYNALQVDMSELKVELLSAHEQLKESRTALHEKVQSMQSLQIDLEYYEGKVSELTSQQSLLSAELLQSKGTVHKLSEELGRLNAELLNASDMVQEKEGIIALKNQELEGTINRLMMTEDILRTREQELYEKSAKITELELYMRKNFIDELRTQMSALSEEVSMNKKVISKNIEALALKAAEVNELAAKLADANDYKASLVAEFFILQSNLRTTATERDSERAIKMTLIDQLNEEIDQKRRVEAELNITRDRLRSQDSEVESLRKELEEVNDSYLSTQESLLANQNCIRGREGEVKYLSSKLRFANDELKEREEQLESLRCAWNAAEKVLQTSVRDKEVELRARETEIAAANASLVTLESQYVEASDSLRKVEAKLLAREHELATSVTKINELHGFLSTAQESLRSADTVIMMKSLQLDSARSEIVALEKRHVITTDSLRAYQESIYVQRNA